MESQALINWLKIALYFNAMAGVYRTQNAASDVSWILRTVENRRSLQQLPLIYCFMAVRSLLAVDGLQLAARAPLMRIKTKTKLQHRVPHLHCREVSELI